LGKGQHICLKKLYQGNPLCIAGARGTGERRISNFLFVGNILALADNFRSMIKIFLMFWVFLAIANMCFGQRAFLMLQKRNKNKNAYYEPGEEISFRVKGSKQKISGEILALKDSAIVFNGFEIRVGEISSLYIDEKTKWWLRFKIEQLGLIAGVAYLTLDFLNNGQISGETVVISGSLIGVGLMGRFLIGNRIKIRGRTKLQILSL
jgi:hypothetical protein